MTPWNPSDGCQFSDYVVNGQSLRGQRRVLIELGFKRMSVTSSNAMSKMGLILVRFCLHNTTVVHSVWQLGDCAWSDVKKVISQGSNLYLCWGNSPSATPGKLLLWGLWCNFPPAMAIVNNLNRKDRTDTEARLLNGTCVAVCGNRNIFRPSAKSGRSYGVMDVSFCHCVSFGW